MLYLTMYRSHVLDSELAVVFCGCYMVTAISHSLYSKQPVTLSSMLSGWLHDRFRFVEVYDLVEGLREDVRFKRASGCGSPQFQS